MYRTIDAAFWSDPKINCLDPRGKLLALYLVTNPHSHVGGIYYLPEPIVSHETGLSKRELDTLWDTLSGAGFCRIDKKTSVVWVVKMFFYQGRGEKNEKSVASHLRSLHNSSLVNEFLHAYPTVARWVKDRVSIGYPAQDHLRTPEQEQEQEQDKDQEIHTDARKRAVFVKPTLEEVRAYCSERQNRVDPETWLAYYEANGWRVGRNPMKDWKSAIITWEKNSYGNGTAKQQPTVRGLSFGDGTIADSL